MATELLLSGQCPPDCGDPCVSNAPLGSTYLCVPPSDPDLLFRTVVSDPCQASDWTSICDVCTVDPQEICDIVANNCPHMTMVENANGTFTITDPDSGAVITINPNANVNHINDETGGNAPTPPVNPANPPTAVEGDTLIEVFDDSIVYWTYTGGSWTLTSQFSGLHTQVYHNDETGGNAPLAPIVPANPPGNEVENDTLIEFYDDATLFWKYDGTNWVLDYTGPVCCPSVTTTIPNAAFADPAAPTTPEAQTWIDNNGPFRPGTIFVLPGNGTATDPDWSWHYDGTTATRIEYLPDVTFASETSNFFNTQYINPADNFVDPAGIATLSVTNPSAYDRVLQVTFIFGASSYLIRTAENAEPGDELFDNSEFSIDGGGSWTNTLWSRGWSEFDPVIDPTFTGTVELSVNLAAQSLVRTYTLAAGATIDLAARLRVRSTVAAGSIRQDWTPRANNIVAILHA